MKPSSFRHRSRLARQENKRMVQQTLAIVVASIAFLVLFFWVGVPSLIKLAVALGNSKSTSRFAQEVDTIPPAPPQLDLLPVATASATITLTGTTEAGVKVYLFQNGIKTQETTADNQGNFTFLNVNLSSGNTSFYAQSIDLAGNQSHNSTTQVITFDNEPPKLDLTKPQDGQQFVGQTQQLIDIVGTTDPQANVYLNDRQLVVTGDGSFSTKYQLQEGDNLLTFTAIDEANNKTETSLTVSFSR